METKKVRGLVLVTLAILSIATTVNAKEKPKIYIDAGHGCKVKYTDNKKTVYGFTNVGSEGEADYVDVFTKNLIKKFDKAGYINAQGIEELYFPNGIKGSRELIGNDGRRILFESSDCDLMIQIHYDESNDLKDSGGHVIYSNNSKYSKDLAKEIARAMEKNKCRMLNRIEDHISERSDLSIYNEPTEKPIVLIELGFGVEGKADYEYLRNKADRLNLYKAIIEGVNTFEREYKNGMYDDDMEE